MPDEMSNNRLMEPQSDLNFYKNILEEREFDLIVVNNYYRDIHRPINEFLLNNYRAIDKVHFASNYYVGNKNKTKLEGMNYFIYRKKEREAKLNN